VRWGLILALIATSMVRGRLPRSLWRPVHLLAYLCWPVAFVHGLAAARDLRQGWLLALAVGCALLVAAAAAWRVATAVRQAPPAARVAEVFAEHAERRHHRGRPDRERS
jgi:methionine sulfoxide reductase heme-binding subunit